MHHIPFDDDPPLPEQRGPVFSAQKAYYDSRERYEHADRVAKEAKRAMDSAEQDLISAMMDQGTTSVSLEDGTRIDKRSYSSMKVNKDTTPAVIAFLDDNGYDSETMKTTKLDRAQVIDLIHRAIEDGELSPLDIPKEMDYKRGDKIYVTGWKKRKTTNYD